MHSPVPKPPSGRERTAGAFTCGPSGTPVPTLCPVGGGKLSPAEPSQSPAATALPKGERDALPPLGEVAARRADGEGATKTLRSVNGAF